MADLVTSAEVKAFLQIEHSDDDALISALITYYTSAIESWLGALFTKTTCTEYIDGDHVDLVTKYVPIAEVTSVTDTDDDSVVNAESYSYDPDAGLIYLSANSSYGGGGDWGAGRRRWRVVYEGGYDGAPADVKLAALKLITMSYNKRDTSFQSERLGDYSYGNYTYIPPDIQLTLNKYKRNI